LFGGNAGLGQALDDIAAVSSRFEATISRYANPSGTGRALGTLEGRCDYPRCPPSQLRSAASVSRITWHSR
jgi:hypothetical protein